MRVLHIVLICLMTLSCKNQVAEEGPKAIKQPPYEVGDYIGYMLKYDNDLDNIVDVEATAEVIGKGYSWSEGPLWLAKDSVLLFSDVPENKIYIWSPRTHPKVFLEPSGYTGEMPSESGEAGSNGLTLDTEGKLLLCQHGNRAVARMKEDIRSGSPIYEMLATHYQEKKFNSPNDLICTRDGDIYFTDPPYGLASQDDSDPKKELPFNGIFKLKKSGQVLLLCDSISRPNGIAMFPGGKKILVACSDPAKPNWYTWDVQGDSLKNGQIFYSAAGHEKDMAGLPDGCKIDTKGNVYATGPGGIYFFNEEGKLLGLFRLVHPTSNVALSDDEQTLFITNDKYVLRLKMK